MRTLQALIIENRKEDAKTAYIAQMLWQINGQLYAYAGGKDFSLPKYSDLFLKKRAEEKQESAQDIIKNLAEKFRERRNKFATGRFVRVDHA